MAGVLGKDKVQSLRPIMFSQNPVKDDERAGRGSFYTLPDAGYDLTDFAIERDSKYLNLVRHILEQPWGYEIYLYESGKVNLDVLGSLPKVSYKSIMTDQFNHIFKGNL
jgi:hypothetical protein